jgi:hypothetical protein
VSYTRLQPAEVERIAQAVIDGGSSGTKLSPSARAIASELGRSHSSVLAASKSDAVLKIVYRERAKARHRQESADTYARKAGERLADRGIVVPPGREVETARVVERSAKGGGRVLGVIGIPGAADWARGFRTTTVELFDHTGKRREEYADWLNRHDQDTPAQRAADDYEAAVDQAMRSLNSSTPTLRGSDGVIRPLQIALEREPELQEVVEQLQARIEQARIEKAERLELATREAEHERARAERALSRDARQAEIQRDRMLEARFRTSETQAERAARMPPLTDVLDARD